MGNIWEKKLPVLNIAAFSPLSLFSKQDSVTTIYITFMC
jgi:hypothetical protein